MSACCGSLTNHLKRWGWDVDAPHMSRSSFSPQDGPPGSLTIRPTRHLRLVVAFGGFVLGLSAIGTSTLLGTLIGFAVMATAVRVLLFVRVVVSSNGVVRHVTFGRRRSIPLEEVICAHYVAPRRISVSRRELPRHSSLFLFVGELEPLSMSIYEHPANSPWEFADHVNQFVGYEHDDGFGELLELGKKEWARRQQAIASHVKAGSMVCLPLLFGFLLLRDGDELVPVAGGVALVLLGMVLGRWWWHTYWRLKDWIRNGGAAAMRSHAMETELA